MYFSLLAILYLVFISLGLPDSLLGTAWPIMQLNFDVLISYMSILSVITSFGTIISSLYSDWLTNKFGVGRVVAASVLLSAISIAAYAVVDSFWVLCLISLPYGLAAGAIDAAVNNFVALHYKSSHMSWLHCFWGVGVSISPYIMSISLANTSDYRQGYATVAALQVAILFVVLTAMPLFKKVATRNGAVASATENRESFKISQLLQIKGVKLILMNFFCYCAIEATVGAWASSYFVYAKGIDADVAARFTSYFFIGITAGRFASGFIANKFGDQKMILLGESVIALGCVMLFFNATTLAGLLLIGLGCAPIYPSIIHSTPDNFGAQYSQAIIGLEMAGAYTGLLLMPALFGVLATEIGVELYPIYTAALAILLITTTVMFNKKIARS
ncbi:MFS transporter [Candidatus Epulonipiscium viviparus]|uniref:MFS transporter n=1 Tax=Candidatus Epulonipiscium viviparus TaxID=420336 RepID=UPI00049606D7|nr:MFS transporter [Candidatus Epulopiscium viviparus]